MTVFCQSINCSMLHVIVLVKDSSCFVSGGRLCSLSFSFFVNRLKKSIDLHLKNKVFNLTSFSHESGKLFSDSE